MMPPGMGELRRHQQSRKDNMNDEDQDWRDIVEVVVYTVMIILCGLVIGTAVGLIYGVMK